MAKIFLVLALCGLATAQPAKPACPCSVTIVCLSERQMADYAEHVEMENNVMGNHVNLAGIAAFGITYEKDGTPITGKVISGNPIAATHLLNSIPKWQFRPVSIKGKKKEACGRLSLRFKIVNGKSSVEVVKPPE